MKIRILAVGAVRGALAPAVAEYRDRASRYWKLEVEELSSGGSGRAAADMADEGTRLLERIDPNAFVWSLTRAGKGITSRGLAAALGKLAVEARREVTFVLGGAYGLAPDVLTRSDRKLSLSPMTLPHQMARLVLLEQLYRAGTIERNEPYHKGS